MNKPDKKREGFTCRLPKLFARGHNSNLVYNRSLQNCDAIFFFGFFLNFFISDFMLLIENP